MTCITLCLFPKYNEPFEASSTAFWIDCFSRHCQHPGQVASSATGYNCATPLWSLHRYHPRLGPQWGLVAKGKGGHCLSIFPRSISIFSPLCLADTGHHGGTETPPFPHHLHTDLFFLKKMPQGSHYGFSLSWRVSVWFFVYHRYMTEVKKYREELKVTQETFLLWFAFSP